MSSLAINVEITKLAPSTLIDLIIIDATPIGGDMLRFHDGTNAATESVIFKGETYNPFPLKITGVEVTGKGEPPRPHVTFANVARTFTALNQQFQDLVGAVFVRKRVYVRDLDVAGEYNSNAPEYPEEVYIFNRPVKENKLMVEYELGTLYDIEGPKLPRRVVTHNMCWWTDYRDPVYCKFADNRVVADSNNAIIGSAQYYQGAWDASSLYVRDRSVSYTDAGYECVFTAIYGNGLTTFTGAATAPPNATYWTKVQRIRGAHDATITYDRKDVVYVEIRSAKRFFISKLPVPPGVLITNTNYWEADVCGKLLTSCRLRQDPLTLNKPLTYGAFPGTAKMPEL